MGLGTFAETALVHEASCIPVETDLPSEQLALIGCGVTTGLVAVFNTARVGPGNTVAVVGCGGVGSSVVQGARITGASRLIAVDPEAFKRDAARAFGATDVIDPADGDPVEQLRSLTGGRGVDFAFEAVGSPTLITQALEMTRRGGTTVLVGLPDHHAELTMLTCAAQIYGTEGSIELPAFMHCPQHLTITRAGRSEQVDCPNAGNGLQYEAAHAQDCLRGGMAESPVMALDETSSIMRTLDVIRERIGLVYPGDRTRPGPPTPSRPSPATADNALETREPGTP